MSNPANPYPNPIEANHDPIRGDAEPMNSFEYGNRSETYSDYNSDRSRELLIGSAAIAAAAITAIVVLQHRRKREKSDPWIESLAELETTERQDRHAGVSKVHQLAERQLERVGSKAEDILDALVGTAFTKMISLISDAVPSFRSEYERASMRR